MNNAYEKIIQATWQHRPLGHVYHQKISVFDASVLQQTFQYGYVYALRRMGYNEHHLVDIMPYIEQSHGIVAGDYKENITAYIRLLEHLPDNLADTTFYTLYLGLEEVNKKSQPLKHKIVAMKNFVRGYLPLSKKIKKYQAIANQSCWHEVDFSQQSMSELSFHLQELMAIRLYFAELNYSQELYCVLVYCHCLQLCREWCDDAKGMVLNSFLASDQEIIGMEPTLRIRELAKIAMKKTTFVTLLNSASYAEITLHMQHLPYFKDRFTEYLGKYKQQSFHAFSVISPRFAEQPLKLLRIIGKTALWLQSVNYQSSQKRSSEALSFNLADRISNPLKRFWFENVLNHCQTLINERINLFYSDNRLYSEMGLTLNALGKHWYDIDCLQHPDDLSFLKYEEIMSANITDESIQAYASTIKIRRTEGKNAHWATKNSQSDALKALSSQQGNACSKGLVCAKVRCLDETLEFQLEAGEIIVVEQLNPGWAIWLPCCAGLIVSNANRLTHIIILAKALAIPTVTGIKNAHQWLQTGDMIELNGNNGLVTRQPPLC